MTAWTDPAEQLETPFEKKLYETLLASDVAEELALGIWRELQDTPHQIELLKRHLTYCYLRGIQKGMKSTE